MIKRVIKEKDNDDSIFYYIPNYLNIYKQNNLLFYLDNINDFIPSFKFNNGISRYQKWYNIDKKYFCPLWKVRYPQWNSFEIDDTINKLIIDIQKYINNFDDINIPIINSCLINKYPKGENFIAPHRDSILSFGEKPTIIGLSIGETRNIDFIRNDNYNNDNNDNNDNFSFTLHSGSIFIMAGSSQIYYKHTIKKSYCNDVRYSLTFREFIL